jgi:hypothetical protein
MLCILKELHKINLRYNSILLYNDITVKTFYLNKFQRKLPRTKSQRQRATTIIILSTSKTNSKIYKLF